MLITKVPDPDKADGKPVIVTGPSGQGDPNGLFVGSPGDVYTDLSTGAIIPKLSGINTATGWNWIG